MAFRDLFRQKSVEHILTDAKHLVEGPHNLKRNLTVIDLTALGIAAIIGAGIFSTIGTAATTGGPAVSLLFVFTAVACGFSAMCYAQFASRIPISGSAYTYAYASFGELFAWIIGWDLIMEYAIGNIAVAISWSDYFTGLMSGLGVHLPEYICVDYLTALRGHTQVAAELLRGVSLQSFSLPLQEAYLAWQHAPLIFGVHLIADIPAFIIVVFISVLVYVGIYETKMAGNLMVLLKIIILLLVIGVGSFYISPKNWSPFAPNGLGGVLKGVSGVFFAYIGFDAISTTAEECRNPGRDLPRSILLSLLITTVLYVVISLVLTGIVHYSELGVGDPLAYAFQKLHLTKFSGLIALSAVIAMASVLLVFQVGQPRIWMSMSRDGLLPKRFSKIHPKFRTPAFATIIAGIFVALPSLFMNLTEVTDLTSIGTLFAFILVSGGVIVLDQQEKKLAKNRGEYRDEQSPWHHGTTASFRVPYLNSRYYLPLVWAGIFVLLYFWNPPELGGVFLHRESPGVAVPLLHHYTTAPLWHEFPILLFVLVALIITVMAIIRQFSLIPVLGLLTNMYLMAQLGITNWMRFLVWLAVGLVIYFSFGRWHSKIRNPQSVIRNP
ncbi:MAG TPA: amino acid permease [Bacteroidales bacterium]|nr:amino acid permease [Bacteroidales bacterium]